MYSLDDFEAAILTAAHRADLAQELQDRKRQEREWLRHSLRADFDEQTLAWLEPLVMQRWMALRGYPPKGFDILDTFRM